MKTRTTLPHPGAYVTVSTAPSETRLTVTGHACVRSPPDQVTLRFGLGATEPTVEEALRNIATQRAALMRGLTSIAISPDDIQTTGPEVSPRHTYEEHCWTFKGMEGCETISLRVPHRPGRLNEILQALAADLPHMRTSVTYQLHDATTIRRQALAAAVEDARQRAEAIAWAAGFQLGAVHELVEMDEGVDRRDNDALAAPPLSSAAEPAAHEIAVGAAVQSVWALTS